MGSEVEDMAELHGWTPPPGFGASPGTIYTAPPAAAWGQTQYGTGFAGGTVYSQPGTVYTQPGTPYTQPATGYGYQEEGAFRGEAEVGGSPYVSGTVDTSGGGNSVYSVGGEVLNLP